MADKRVIVTYCDDAQIWPLISEHLSCRLPLRNLTWNGLPSRTTIPPASATLSPQQSPITDISCINTNALGNNTGVPGATATAGASMSNSTTSATGGIDPSKNTHTSSTRSIHTLDIELKKFSPDVFPKEGPITLNPSTIFCHMYLVSCEDIQVYKTAAKKQLQDWINLITSKRNQEWLIVYLPGPSEKRSSRFLSVGAASVVDKIKSDFNTQKRDRVTELRLFQPAVSEIEVWADFFGKLKESILSGFTMNLLQRDEDTKRLEAQRHLPGWNYNQYFIMKEMVATIYEAMTIYDSALQCYDELASLFTQMQTDQGTPWFKSFGATESGDDSEDVCNLQRKSYRELILQTNCTIFDFRCYLFGRQCQLLIKLNNPTEIGHRAKTFVTTFARTLREYQASLIPYFCEAWVYSTCLHIVSHCEEVLAVSPANSIALEIYEAAKAELLHHARIQLDILGGLAGLIPPSSVLTIRNREGLGAHLSISAFTNKELKSALQDPELFDKLYLNLTARTFEGYELAHRRRHSMMMRNDAATLHFHRRRYLEASKEWDPIVFKYTEDGWTAIDTILVDKLARCQQELGERIKLVQSCLHVLSHPTGVSNDELCGFVDLVQTVSSQMEGPIIRESDSIFRISVLGMVVKVGDEDGVNVELEVFSNIPKDITMDQISLTMVGGEVNDDVVLRRKKVLLKPGSSNIVRVSSEKTCVPGPYAVENIKLDLGLVSFSYNMLKDNRKHVFKIVERATSLRVTVSLPDQITYGEPVSRLQVRIHARQSGIESGVVVLSPLSGLMVLPLGKNISYRIYSALETRANEAGRELTTESVDSHFQIPNLGKDEIIEFEAPFTTRSPSRMDSPIGHVDPETNEVEHMVKVTMNYTTSDGRRRIYSAVERIKMGIPLLINHNFMDSETGYNLSVRVAGRRPVPSRLVKARLLAPEKVVVKEYVGAPEQTLFVEQQHAFSYSLVPGDEGFYNTSRNGVVIECQFNIQYCGLQEEVELYVLSKLEEYLIRHSAGQYVGFLCQYLRDRVIGKLDFTNYAIMGSMDFVEHDKASLALLLSSEDSEVRDRLLGLMQNFQEAHKKIDVDLIRQTVKVLPKTIVYNVYLPIYPILVLAELKLATSARRDFVVGDVIPCILTTEEVRWLVSEVSSLEVLCEALIQSDLWMFSGTRRHALCLKKGEPQHVSVSLIPLKTGKLPLPTFQISLMRVNDNTASDGPKPNSQGNSLIAHILFLGARQVSVVPQSSSAQMFVSDDVTGLMQSGGGLAHMAYLLELFEDPPMVSFCRKSKNAGLLDVHVTHLNLPELVGKVQRITALQVSPHGYLMKVLVVV
ncbi:hypothetical protein SeMB42_g03332 [Synchytrium endobioticum]|uniref:Trafficking protein particle complex subunit 10 n=1 Tax=Synchytrium endobioticum TaxID=286115 RepID=A0A507D7F8_9FUNG|nr:hypothetical protein SeMB42_g03332 [Synchytrium endobioticum]